MIYREIYDGPPFGYRANRGRKKYVALHNTSNDGTVREELSYSKWRPDKTSTHYYGDNLEIAQSLDTELCANHAGSTEGNSFAIAWEFTGTNGKSRAWWMANVVWAKVAKQMARDCRLYGIEPRLLTVAEMRAGKLTGFVTHDLMRQAWGGTDHTDPGPGFPVDYLLALVRAELEPEVFAADAKTDPHAVALIHRMWGLLSLAPTIDNHVNNPVEPNALAVTIRRIDTNTAMIGGLVKALAALADAVNAGGGNVETAAILAHIDERAAEEVERDAAQSARIAELETKLAEADEREAAAARAAADVYAEGGPTA